MAPDNVEAVRLAFDAWNRADWAALREIYAPDVTFDAGAMWPEGTGALAGADRIIANFESIFAAFDRNELVAEELIEAGDAVVVPAVWRGSLRGSATVIEQRLVSAYTLRGGRIARVAVYSDLDDALDAVGAPRRPHRSGRA